MDINNLAKIKFIILELYKWHNGDLCLKTSGKHFFNFHCFYKSQHPDTKSIDQRASKLYSINQSELFFHSLKQYSRSNDIHIPQSCLNELKQSSLFCADLLNDLPSCFTLLDLERETEKNKDVSSALSLAIFYSDVVDGLRHFGSESCTWFLIAYRNGFKDVTKFFNDNYDAIKCYSIFYINDELLESISMSNVHTIDLSFNQNRELGIKIALYLNKSKCIRKLILEPQLNTFCDFESIIQPIFDVVPKSQLRELIVSGIVVNKIVYQSFCESLLNTDSLKLEFLCICGSGFEFDDLLIKRFHHVHPNLRLTHEIFDSNQ